MPDPLPRPRLGASAAVFRGANVLLVQRASGPYRGVWSLPGGHIELGEKAIEAARRELLEETGVTAHIAGLADIANVILADDHGSLRAHYVLAVFYGNWASGEVRAGRDAKAARWVDLPDLGRLTLTDGAEAIIRKAAALIRGR